MRKILPVFFILFVINLSAQKFWRVVDENSIILDRDAERGVIPIDYSTYHLDMKALMNYLKKAPKQFNKEKKSIPVYIPMPDGSNMLFDVVKSPVMMSKLAEKYPNIRSYKGIAHDDKKINIRFNIGSKGFFASIYNKKGNIYIDPYASGVKNYYISYYTSNYKVDISDINLNCGLDSDEIIFNDSTNLTEINFPDELLDFRDASACDSVRQYNYRLALACTGEWGQKHGGTKEAALSDMVTSVNRINQIYENEFAIHLNLIDDNDKLIWLDPDTDPYKNPTIGGALLGENFDAVNNTIGMNSYDIGHIFTNSCTDVGGIARLAAVCQTFKAMGVTCHYSSDLNYIITNVTCHEMGHQFSAAHTFNNCSGNESGSGFEPGGGTTIMAYCGLCGPNNVDYKCLETFHSFSIQQIKYYSREGGGRKCAEKISSDNTAPEVSIDYNNGFYIPIQTPFVLEGSAYDCDGDNLVYSWEQMDVGPQSLIGHPEGNAPIFTAREVSDSPVRYFPNLYDLLYNQSNNSELLPSYERDLNFRFIARDNHEVAGGTDWVDMSFKADSSSGPFLVSYPNNFLKFRTGDSLTVKWDVANTDNEKVNCQNVDILLSLDKGYTYPYTLKYKTTNDGEELVYMPDTITSNARLMVKASNNIFFDICNYNLKIREREDTNFLFDLDEISGKLCLPYSVSSKISTRGFNGYEDSIKFKVIGLPDNAKYKVSPEIIKTGETAIIEFNFDNVKKDGYSEVYVLGISTKGDTVKRPITWDIYSNSYKDINIISPEVGSTGQAQNSVFIWEKDVAYDYVNLYISPDPSFPEEKTFVRNYITDTFYQPTELLEYSTLYYWKLEYGNNCGIISPDTLYTFSTFATDCKDYISDEVPRQIKSSELMHSSIFIDDDITITDVSVRISGSHTRFREISASLIAPNYDTVLLFSPKPFNYQGPFNMAFNDQAYYKVKSPPSGIFRPDSPLSILNGKNGKGEWKLIISDNKYQQSGTLKRFSLNVCAKIDLINPVLVNNNLLKIPYNKPWTINSDYLKATDANNSASDLIFTIVNTPSLCSLFKGNAQLFIGDRFTQEDINNGLISVLYPGNEKVSDKFYFTVIDGEGGAIGITAFNFESDEKVKVDELFANKIQLFPNPASNSVNINIDKTGNFNFEIFNLSGQKLMSKNITGGFTSVDLTKFNDGIFIVKIHNNLNNYIGKIIKQR